MDALDDRSRAIFKHIVETYLETGGPAWLPQPGKAIGRFPVTGIDFATL